MSEEESKDSRLIINKVLDFEVHAVYGVHFRMQEINPKTDWKDWFEKKKQEDFYVVREGWTPIYRDHCNTITIELDTPDWCKNIKVEHPKIFSYSEQLNKSKPSPIEMKVSRCLTIREDGVAAVTIRLQANDPTKTYDLADILASLQLAPRIRSGKKLHKNNVKIQPSDEKATVLTDVYKIISEDDHVYKFISDDEEKLKQAILETHKVIDRLAVKDKHSLAEDKSPLFKLFLGALKQIVSEEPYPSWGEYCTQEMVAKKESEKEDDSREEKKENYSTTHIFPWMGDSQIPYFVVFATLPKEEYTKAFLETGAETQSREEKKKVRQKYTSELAAILLRWLTPHNAKFISIDFLQSLKLLDDDGIFVNQYMNSLSFVTYSSIGTICLRSDRDEKHRHEELDPQEATYGSILRCVELSRLRWHHAYRLNLSLDKLTKKVVEYGEVKGFEELLEELLELRAEAAMHFLDPLTYQWDATVGADIASFLQIDVIENIEEECLQKLGMVKELVHEKFDVLRAQAMQKELKRSGSLGDEPSVETKCED